MESVGIFSIQDDELMPEIEKLFLLIDVNQEGKITFPHLFQLIKHISSSNKIYLS